MNGIFDSHAHYDDEAFDSDREEVLKSLENFGVGRVLNVGANIKDSEKSVEIANEYDFVWASVGIHPHYVSEKNDGYIEFFERLIANKKVVAVGETGLDYHYENFDKELQKYYFKEHIELANRFDLPLIIHSRDACDDTLNMVKEYRPKRAVVHCFGGSAETAAEYLKMDYYIGFTGVVTFKNAKRPVEAAAAVPLDRLLLETDCPYMAPTPYRGERCDSRMIIETAKKIAEIKGESLEKVIEVTAENAARLFLSE